jgi:hypothetical protein
VSLEQALRIEHLSLEGLHDRASSRGNERFTVECLVTLCLDQANAPTAAAALADK